MGGRTPRRSCRRPFGTTRTRSAEPTDHGRLGVEYRPRDSPLEGAFHGWANPGEDEADRGDYPLVFDVAGIEAYDDLALPGLVDAQIAAFAHEVSVHESADAYRAAQAGEPIEYASRSFVPSGLFGPDGGVAEAPESFATFTGHVVESNTLKNAMTGSSFVWALVDTLGGTFDVVIDSSLLTQAPSPGGVLSGSF